MYNDMPTFRLKKIRAYTDLQLRNSIWPWQYTNLLSFSSVADLEGAEPAPVAPFERRTDAVTHAHVS